jgi:hypothetical protein
MAVREVDIFDPAVMASRRQKPRRSGGVIWLQLFSVPSRDGNGGCDVADQAHAKFFSWYFQHSGPHPNIADHVLIFYHTSTAKGKAMVAIL